jgi:hypothetical protein
VQHLNPDIAEVEFLPRLEREEIKLYGCTFMQGIDSTCLRSQTSASRAVVGLHMGIDDINDAKVVTLSRFYILDDVQLGVYDRTDPFPFSAQQVGCAPGFWSQELTKDHGLSP